MNYLDIALGKNITLPQTSQWNFVKLTADVNPATLAAIVIDGKNQAELELIQKLKTTSGLNPTLIKLPSNPDEQMLQKVFAQASAYYEKMVPQYLQDLISFSQTQPISFTTPGHHNGQYYDKHPSGVVFNRFFGKNLMYADTSDTVPQLGDMMTHEGGPLSAEQQAARTYHADKVYFCTNGTTSANSICSSALLTEDDLVLFDRNNHKSLYNSALVMTGARPVYLPTDRNALGLIGEINSQALNEEAIRKEIAKVDPQRAKANRPFRLAIIQLETYDGIFQNPKYIIDKIGSLCDYILFDCAWAGFENFLPIMAKISPLNLELGPDDPGFLVTQSLHKQQAGMGQASQILKKDSHLKGQRRYVDHKHFNNAYLKFVTTSYSYPLYASLVVNSALTAGSGNKLWWDKILRLGIDFRKQLLAKSQLFRPFVSENFANYTTEELATTPQLWELTLQDKWHGFSQIAPHQAIIDPMKITLATPGIDNSGAKYTATGLPAPIVSEFLMEKDIIRAKNDLYSLLFLLTPGDTEQDLTILLNALLEFEELYLHDAALSQVLPKLAAQYPERYRDYTIQQLANEMHKYYSTNKTFSLQKDLFAKKDFQNYSLTPKIADQKFMKNQSELVDLAQVKNRIALEGALPYPPGIFVVAPGEIWTKTAQQYFEVLLGAIEQFPGFVPEIQGVYFNKDKNGTLKVQAEVLKENN
ncbi:putative ornithine decarboxylase [Lactobacillus sp. PV012]|uniref:putative ornithine decarboxylase n=1 Tax=Lactobacillus sp. PV012 TaxID=2594494 RepID=UPI00224080FC|nr:putative ornithine decarboxylase [Lactobacillus sp. PV012]QNQ82778.1 putative ornithine decarboxylase [Lactobacillus sp. PV012]